MLLCALWSSTLGGGGVTCVTHVRLGCAGTLVWGLTFWEDGVVLVTGGRLIRAGDAACGCVAADVVVVAV